MQYLLKESNDKKFKAYLVNYFLEQFRRTLYRQTMFAEFEKQAHELCEKGEALNASVFCAMYEKLIRLPEATITSSFDHNLEIGGATTSKADALRQMGKLLGIRQDEMMAIGDSPNDIAMLLESGTPVAVGNAKPEVKEIAKYIAPTNHEDGVADAIEKFVLA